MDTFTTVFLFTNKANAILGDSSRERGFGLILTIIGILVLLALLKEQRKSDVKIYIVITAIFLAATTSFWGLSAFSYSSDQKIYQQLSQIYSNHDYRIAEGTVHVIELSSGREHGDRVQIGAALFEIGKHSYPFSIYGYMNTIAKNGVLKEGIYARVYYVDEVIIRIDIRESNKL